MKYVIGWCSLFDNELHLDIIEADSKDEAGRVAAERGGLASDIVDYEELVSLAFSADLLIAAKDVSDN
jgi:hypothetical protein